jgi:hypothetical protein
VTLGRVGINTAFTISGQPAWSRGDSDHDARRLTTSAPHSRPPPSGGAVGVFQACNAARQRPIQPRRNRPTPGCGASPRPDDAAVAAESPAEAAEHQSTGAAATTGARASRESRLAAVSVRWSRPVRYQATSSTRIASSGSAAGFTSWSRFGLATIPSITKVNAGCFGSGRLLRAPLG